MKVKWTDDNPRIPDTATWVAHPTADEGSWWYEMSLPRTCTLDQVQARYWTLRRMRRNASEDDKSRTHEAYNAAISEKLGLAAYAAALVTSSRGEGEDES